MAYLCLILAVALFVCLWRVSKLSKANKVVEQTNEQIRQWNKEWEEQNQELQHKHEQLIDDYNSRAKGYQEDVNKWLERIKSEEERYNRTREYADDLRRAAQDRANESYKARYAEVAHQFNEWLEGVEKEKNARLEQISAQVGEAQRAAADIQLSIDKERAELEDLKEKHHAFLQSQLKARAAEEKDDFHKLQLSAFDLEDVELLRKLQPRFKKVELIDKLIWSAFYQAPFAKLTAQLGMSPSVKTCGIYKLTDLITGEAYIGQSVNIRDRWAQHIKAGLSSQPTNKLYQAMHIDGPENFTFEILSECSKEDLDKLEAYWIEFYDTKNLGLNTVKGNLNDSK